MGVDQVAGTHHESTGSTKLCVIDQAAAEGPMRTPPGEFTCRMTAFASAMTAAMPSARSK